jgi:4-amino-4-deoxy-L-arabinose transferase-like glycosyltransferase
MTTIGRERKDVRDLRPMRGWLLVVLAVAAALRFWALGHGIPYALSVDEPEVMLRVLAIMRTGDYNPHFFHYPGFIFYMHLPVAILRFVAGAAGGAWRSLEVVSPGDFYLWSRALTATFGVLTVLVVHQVGLRWGSRHALLAAALLAVVPLHVRESHYVLADVPMTFFVALTWLLALVAHERGTWSAFALAGVAAGLATSTKYTAGLSVLLPLLSAWMTVGARPSRAVAALAALGGFATGFLATSPYTLLDLHGFLNSFGSLLYAFRPGERPEPGWITYLKHLRLNLQWPAVLLVMAGLVLALVRAVRGPERLKWTLLAAFPLVFFWTIADRHQIYARYLMPLLPFLCVLVGCAVVSTVSLLRRFEVARAVRTTLIAALAVAALLPPTVTSLRHLRFIATPTTTQQAYEWLMANAPRGSRIVVENYDLRLPEDRFSVRHVIWLAEEPLDRYRDEGVRYLVATSRSFREFLDEPDRNPDRGAAYRTLFRQAREVARFLPGENRTGHELRILAVEP